MINPRHVSLIKPSIYYALLAALVLGIIYLLSIGPMSSEKQRLGHEIAKLEYSIEEQQELRSLYMTLVRITESDAVELPGYPAPGLFHWAEDMETAIAGLRQAARGLGLQEVHFSPDLKTLGRAPDRFLVHGELSGDYPEFREFMLNLVSGPNFNNLEMMEIMQTRQGSRYVLRFVMTL